MTLTVNTDTKSVTFNKQACIDAMSKAGLEVEDFKWGGVCSFNLNGRLMQFEVKLEDHGGLDGFVWGVRALTKSS